MGKTKHLQEQTPGIEFDLFQLTPDSTGEEEMVHVKKKSKKSKEKLMSSSEDFVK